MSDVLNRMVRRARGELTTIEPLTAIPTLASASPVALNEEMRAAIGVELAPSRSATASNGNALPAAATHDDYPRHGPQSATTVDTIQTTQDAASPVTRVATPVDPQPVADRRMQTSAAATVTNLPLGQAERFMPVSDGASTTHRESEIPPDQPRMLASPQKEASGRTMVPQPEFMGVEHRQNPSESNAHVDDAGIETNREHTEIHITIGSVELRAPRAEAKAAAFRPRVTLNDFLNRKRGHRHE